MGATWQKIAVMTQTQQRDQSEDAPSIHRERAPGRMLIWTEALKFLGVSKPKELYTGLGSVVKIPYSGEGRSAMMHLQFWQSFYNRAPMEPQRILCVLQNCLDAGGFPDPCGRYRLLSMGEEDPDSPSESDNYDY